MSAPHRCPICDRCGKPLRTRGDRDKKKCICNLFSDNPAGYVTSEGVPWKPEEDCTVVQPVFRYDMRGV